LVEIIGGGAKKNFANFLVKNGQNCHKTAILTHLGESSTFLLALFWAKNLKISKKHIFVRKLTTWKFRGSDFSPQKYDKGDPCVLFNIVKISILKVSYIKKHPKKFSAPTRNSTKILFLLVKAVHFSDFPYPLIITKCRKYCANNKKSVVSLKMVTVIIGVGSPH